MPFWQWIETNCVTSGIYSPLGAAFFSNASHPEVVKVVNISGVLATPFSLDPATRDEFSFNYSSPDGDLEPVPAPSGPFAQLLALEVPKYIALWVTVFAPFSVPGYKVSLPRRLSRNVMLILLVVEWRTGKSDRIHGNLAHSKRIRCSPNRTSWAFGILRLWKYLGNPNCKVLARGVLVSGTMF
jgi:hypothetical protein